MRTFLSLSLSLSLFALLFPLHIAASSWNPTLLVNTEAFSVIDDSDSTANIVLQFGDSVAQTLTYDRTAAHFQFSTGLSVLGHMSGSSLHIDGNATVGGHISGSGSLKLHSGAVISRAEDSEFIRLRDTTNNKQIGIHTGAGSPEAVVTAVVGSLYVDNDSGDLYRKSSGSGNTGWVEMTSGSGAIHMAKMTRDAAQSIPTGVFTKINFDTEEFDVGNIADVTTTGSGRITIKKAGKYLVAGQFYIAVASINKIAKIYKNGVAYSTSAVIVTGNTGVPNVTDVLDLISGDYIELIVYQDTGSAQNVQVGLELKPRLSVIELMDTGAGGLHIDNMTEVDPAIDDYVAIADTSDSGKNKKASMANVWVPTGTVLDYAGTTEPDGYLFCYGQAVSRTTYADLFDVVSTTYGVGDGSTTFNLPDLRGRTVAGQDDMGGTSANRLTDQSGGLDGDVLGDSGGAETHTLVTAELAAHTHGIITGAYNGNIGGTAAGSEAAANTITSNSTGGNGAHNNVQPSFILNKIIKY